MQERGGAEWRAGGCLVLVPSGRLGSVFSDARFSTEPSVCRGPRPCKEHGMDEVRPGIVGRIRAAISERAP
jgi:hypothetical protein